MKTRLGAPKVVVAAAPKLARLVYALLTRGQSYVRQSLAEYEEVYRQQQLRTLQRLATKLTMRVEAAG